MRSSAPRGNRPMRRAWPWKRSEPAHFRFASTRRLCKLTSPAGRPPYPPHRSQLSPRILVAFPALLVFGPTRADDKKRPDTLPGTNPLTMKGDIAEQMVAGVDKFLLRETEASVKNRESHYKRDYSSHIAYNNSLEGNRKRLTFIL